MEANQTHAGLPPETPEISRARKDEKLIGQDWPVSRKCVVFFVFVWLFWYKPNLEKFVMETFLLWFFSGTRKRDMWCPAAFRRFSEKRPKSTGKVWQENPRGKPTKKYFSMIQGTDSELKKNNSNTYYFSSGLQTSASAPCRENLKPQWSCTSEWLRFLHVGSCQCCFCKKSLFCLLSQSTQPKVQHWSFQGVLWDTGMLYLSWVTHLDQGAKSS